MGKLAVAADEVSISVAGLLIFQWSTSDEGIDPMLHNRPVAAHQFIVTDADNFEGHGGDSAHCCGEPSG